MRKIKEILRLHHELGLARREIGRSVSVSPNTVADVIRRAEAAGLCWPLPEDLNEAALDACLYPPPAPSRVPRPEPDPEQMHRELTRKGVTLQLLWELCRSRHYSHYADAGIMPTSGRRTFSGAVPALMRSA
jgi:transposase